jgi:hypothetical protein
MCDSGSTDNATSVDSIGKPFPIDTTFDMKLLCVSITPFGSPVVPEV